ncbi:MAG: hypothetical protein ACRDMV_05745 [Streptosporangiales bacterium]
MTPTCCISWCAAAGRYSGYCQRHFVAWKQAGRPWGFAPPLPVCRVEGCEGRHFALGYCVKHHGRLRATGDPLGKGPLPLGECIRLRRLVGLPDDGPTDEHRRRWNTQEAS